jgi:hypothetical protein
MDYIEDSIAEDLSRQMKEEIDRKILFDLLVEIGWTRIELPNKFLPVSGVELHKWREQNLTGHYRAHEHIWLFEKSQDAVLFALRWS